MGSGEDRRAFLAGVVLLVSAVVVASALAGPWRPGLRSKAPHPTFATRSLTLTPPPEKPATTGPLWDFSGLIHLLEVLLALVAAVVVLAAVVMLLRQLSRRRRAVDEPGEEAADLTVLADRDDARAAQTLRRGIAAAAAGLRSYGVPRDAVIAAWVALEQAAGDTGVVREPSATPSEFTATVLGATAADPAPAEDLLALYLVARFSTHAVTPLDVERAGACLAALDEALTSRATVGAEPVAPWYR